jgi:polyisoprenoid-binding protein YceI
MKKLILFLAISISLAGVSNAQYLCSSQTCKVSFFSSTPAEDINAVSTTALGVINVKTREVAFSVNNTSFEFPNKLMQEHFNEKYMESEKFPKSTFNGKINEDIDLTKNGEYKVTVTGKLKVHGVEKDRTIPGVVVVKGGTVSIKTDFKVLVKDHNIEIPKLVIANIAEEIKVMIDAQLVAKK